MWNGQVFQDDVDNHFLTEQTKCKAPELKFTSKKLESKTLPKQTA